MIRHLTVAAVVGIGALATAAFGQLPQWYLDTGLPTADTDGDGIPDAWERRTFGDPATPDSNLDRDGDGLTDLEEFAFGSDPRTFSTMGDGWSDKEKLDAGLGSVYCASPAASLAQWLNWLGWSEQQWRALTTTNSQGFAACYADFINSTPPYSQERGGADFWLVTRTDRPAWVTVGDALTTNSFPVRAGSGRVRIRAAYGGPVSLTIDPLPGTLAELPGATNGLWLCQMSVEPYRANTVVFSGNETPTVSGQPDSVDGILLLSAPPAAAVHSLTSPPPAVAMQPLRMTDGAVVLGDGGWYCLCASVPPCDWPDYAMIGCDAVSMTMNGVDGSTPLLSKEDARDIYGARFPCIECTVTQTVANVMYPFIYGRVIFSFRQCEAIGGISGAEEHPPWHEPGYDDHSLCGGIGCMCDDGPHWVIGFEHLCVNTRNLYHPAENPESGKYINHCLGVVWDGQPINLADLCDSCGLDLASLAVWDVNGARQTSSLLVPGGVPSDLEPTVFRVKMLQASNPDIVWDRLFIVVNNRNTKTLFDDWYARFTVETNWLGELPAAYNALGPNNGDPEPQTPNLWEGVSTPGKYYHHTTTLQMRSQPTENWHGHQACYATNGAIIVSGVCAGSADFGHWKNFSHNMFTFVSGSPVRPSHEALDVLPFIRALQLDGNPSFGGIRNMYLTHALVYSGGYIEKYFVCRPAKPNSKALLDPEPAPTP